MELSIQSGENYSHTFVNTSYPESDGYTVKIAFRGRGGSFDFTLTDGLKLEITAENLSTIPFGEYKYTFYAEKSGNRFVIETGTASVLKNFLDADAFDSRSEAEKNLDAITAVINKTATTNILKKTIAGVALEKYPLADLLVLHSKLKMEVESEKRAARLAAGESSGLIIRTVF